MSTMHCQCDECKKHRLHHSPCGCKDGFKNEGFQRHDQHSFSFQHDNQLNFHNGCRNCFKERMNDRFENRRLCDEQFRIRLGGLKSGMAFQMRQLMDSNVKIMFEEGGSIQGKVHFVGTDFLEMVLLSKKGKNKCDWEKKHFYIPFDKIKWAERIEKM
ncbi:hypothetical protein [Domibacillus iocasae]|uniref:Uncharacterized protein n=1 Tax=Domibacillus iocasae TaxID=1714016 RepID=A0A1E7DQK3_9BACI|nr:hypothetical protein [Domibacillus iocasae]OES45334.1 hypothetical protein BA724_04830 [Domibacillus iocasae]